MRLIRKRSCVVGQPPAAVGLPSRPGDFSVYEDLDSYESFDRELYEDSCGLYSRRGSSWKTGLISCGVSLSVLLCVVGYGFGFIHYSFRFYPNTSLNGQDISGMSVADVESLTEQTVDAYQLHVILREGEFWLSADDLGLHMEYEPTVRSLLSRQSSPSWIFSFFQDHTYESEVILTYDDMEAKLAIGNRFILCPARHDDVDAWLRSNGDGSFTYQPGVHASERDEGIGREKIFAAFLSLQDELDLRESEMYSSPYVTQDDSVLAAMADAWNSRIERTFVYRLNGQDVQVSLRSLASQAVYQCGQIVLSGEILKSMVDDWLGMDTSEMSPAEQLYYDGYCYQLVAQVVSDVRLNICSGSLPSYQFDDSCYLRVDLQSHMLSVMKQKEPAAVYELTCTGSASWDALRPSAASLSFLDDQTVVLSNGLPIGSQELTDGFTAKGVFSLVQMIQAECPAYLVFVDGSDEDSFAVSYQTDWSSQQEVLASKEDFLK